MVRSGAKGRDSVILGEVEESCFKDFRLGTRFKKLIDCLAEKPGASLSLACEDWAGTKAAYRFLSNPRVHEEEILSGHLKATRRRFESCEEPVSSFMIPPNLPSKEKRLRRSVL